MPCALPSDELETIQRIHEMGRLGMTQTRIAEELGVNIYTLRARLERRGLRMTPATLVVDARTEEPLEVLLERGEIVAAEPAEPAEVAA